MIQDSGTLRRVVIDDPVPSYFPRPTSSQGTDAWILDFDLGHYSRNRIPSRTVQCRPKLASCSLTGILDKSPVYVDTCG